MTFFLRSSKPTVQQKTEFSQPLPRFKIVFGNRIIGEQLTAPVEYVRFEEELFVFTLFVARINVPLRLVHFDEKQIDTQCMC